MNKFVCKHPWTHFEVNNPNGDVTMCCNNDMVMGNVNEDSIAEIWNSEKFQDARKRMREDGAHSMCPHTCPVLQGGKKYEDIDWFDGLSDDGEPHQNAVANEREFDDGRVKLESTPRWLRFTYSYACNLDCYHCYQREDAKIRAKLPDSFMAELEAFAKRSQVVFPFGGEPFFFGPVVSFLENYNTNLETRFMFITNATLLTDRIYEILEKLTISGFAVSLDAASELSFDLLRVRGRNATWQAVMENLGRLSELKQRKGFSLSLSMTVNRVNCHEIEDFVDLALEHDCEPLLLLVSNPFQTVDFQKSYLVFDDKQLQDMFAQIERSLAKVRQAGLEDAEIHLKLLRANLRNHQRTENNPALFRAKSTARTAYHQLPEFLQLPIRRVVQGARRKRLAEYLRDD